MATKRVQSGTGAFRKHARELMAATEGMDIPDLDRRAKVMTGVVKARQSSIELAQQEAMMNGADKRLDAAGVQRLREDLLRRINRLAADLEAESAAGAAGPE